MIMLNGNAILVESNETVYVQDDITRSLRVTLVALLVAAVANDGLDPAFLKGVLSLARSQAALYGIPWSQVVESLYDVPELGHLIQRLQNGMGQT